MSGMNRTGTPIWVVYNYVRYPDIFWLPMEKSEIRDVAEYRLDRLSKEYPKEHFRMWKEFRK